MAPGRCFNHSAAFLLGVTESRGISSVQRVGAKSLGHIAFLLASLLRRNGS
jgi:hypothetical protein